MTNAKHPHSSNKPHPALVSLIDALAFLAAAEHIASRKPANDNEAPKSDR